MMKNKVMIVTAALAMQMVSHTYAAERGRVNFSGDTSIRGISNALARVKPIMQTFQDMIRPCPLGGNGCLPVPSTTVFWDNFLSASRLPTYIGLSSTEILNSSAVAIYSLSAGGAALSTGPIFTFNGRAGTYAAVVIFDEGGAVLSPVTTVAGINIPTQRAFTLAAGNTAAYSPASLFLDNATRARSGRYWVVAVSYTIIDGAPVATPLTPSELIFSGTNGWDAA